MLHLFFFHHPQLCINKMGSCHTCSPSFQNLDLRLCLTFFSIAFKSEVKDLDGYGSSSSYSVAIAIKKTMFSKGRYSNMPVLVSISPSPWAFSVSLAPAEIKSTPMQRHPPSPLSPIFSGRSSQNGKKSPQLSSSTCKNSKKPHFCGDAWYWILSHLESCLTMMLKS